MIETVLHAQSGPMAVQVTASSSAKMIQQARRLHQHSSRIIVKVPVTTEGLEVIHSLRHEIPTMATAVFHPKQVLAAALAGASYIAPYLGAILQETGHDPFQALEAMMALCRNYQLKAKILGAAIRSAEQAMQCSALGIPGMTLTAALFTELVGDAPETLSRLQRFAVDWKRAQPTALL